jgi:hypothetical protein
MNEWNYKSIYEWMNNRIERLNQSKGMNEYEWIYEWMKGEIMQRK